MTTMKKTKKEKVSFTYQLTTEWNLYNSLLLSCPILSCPVISCPILSSTATHMPYSLHFTNSRKILPRQNQDGVTVQSDDDHSSDKSTLRLRCAISCPHIEAIDVPYANIEKHRKAVTMCEVSVPHMQSLDVFYDRNSTPPKSVAVTRTVELSRYDTTRPAFTSALPLTEMLSLIPYSYWSTPSV